MPVRRLRGIYCYIGRHLEFIAEVLLIIGASVIVLACPASVSSAFADDAYTCSTTHGDSAIAACTRAIGSGQYQGHDLAIAYNDRGIEYKNKGDNTDAMADFNQAIQIDPQYAIAFNSRCNIYYTAMNNPDAAIADCTKAIQLNSQYAEAYFNLGFIYAENNQIDLAMTNLNKALQIDPSYALAYKIRGLVESAKGDTAAAAADAAKAKQLDPTLGN